MVPIYLHAWNWHAENPNNTNSWSYYTVTMNISWIESRDWEISFDIMNNNNRHDYKYTVYSNGNQTWHKDNIYWGYKITARNSSEVRNFQQNFCDSKTKNSGDTYKSLWDSREREWTPDYISRVKHSVSIKHYAKDNTITVSSYASLYTFNNCNSLSSIQIIVGCAADVRVTNFRAKRMTFYGEVKPYITSGDSYFAKNDYWNAVSQYTKAIDKGYKNYNIYFKRAKAYYSAKFYNNAIDDFSSALSYTKTEEAYFYRGLARLFKNDKSGIDDLKNGGQKGIALLREMDVQTNPEDRNGQSKYVSSGTGFFIDPSGYIVTNYHVIDKANSIDVFVTNSGKTYTYKAESVVVDKINDIAIIKIKDSNFIRLSPVPYTFGAGTKDVGTSVFAMGYPKLSYLGEEVKVTDGIISSKTGYKGDITTYQITAPIQPGNSGGPLFDRNGVLVGIINAGVSALDNVGYAIKVSYMDNLIEASPEKIYTPTNNQLHGLSFTNMIKKISPYVVIVKIY